MFFDMASVWIRAYTLKSGKKSFSIYYKDPDSRKSKLYKTLRNKSIADNMADELRNLLDAGKWAEVENPDKKPRLLTLKDCSDAYLRQCKRAVAHDDLSNASLLFYETQHRKVLEEFGEKKLISTMTADRVLDYHIKVRNEVSRRTANARLFALKMILKTALKGNAALKDFSGEIRYFKERTRDRSLTPQELNSLLAASLKLKSGKTMAAAILLAAEHGCSRQEILELREKDIDFNQSSIGTIRFYRRKNKVERMQFLMPRTRKALRELLDHRAFIRHRKNIVHVKSDLVFSRLDGRAVKSFGTAWKAVLAESGISDLHFHDLRTVYGTNLAYAGAALPVIQKLIGHKDPNATERYIQIQHMRELLPWQKRLAQLYQDPVAFEKFLAGAGRLEKDFYDKMDEAVLRTRMPESSSC